VFIYEPNGKLTSGRTEETNVLDFPAPFVFLLLSHSFGPSSRVLVGILVGSELLNPLLVSGNVQAAHASLAPDSEQVKSDQLDEM
jgi:hypothetical protein